MGMQDVIIDTVRVRDKGAVRIKNWTKLLNITMKIRVQNEWVSFVCEFLGWLGWNMNTIQMYGLNFISRTQSSAHKVKSVQCVRHKDCSCCIWLDWQNNNVHSFWQTDWYVSLNAASAWEEKRKNVCKTNKQIFSTNLLSIREGNKILHFLAVISSESWYLLATTGVKVRLMVSLRLAGIIFCSSKYNHITLFDVITNYHGGLNLPKFKNNEITLYID